METMAGKMQASDLPIFFFVTRTMITIYLPSTINFMMHPIELILSLYFYRVGRKVSIKEKGKQRMDLFK